jgi:CheY-like chemotaxis protein
VSSLFYSATMSPMATEKDRVAVLVDDMFFAVKIKSAAEACGRQIERIKSREQLEALRAAPPSLVIVDLNSDRLDPIETIRYLKTQAGLDGVPIVSFVSHVQTDLIRGAQAAGCDHVLPRSAFTQMLSGIVAGNLPTPGNRL